LGPTPTPTPTPNSLYKPCKNIKKMN